MALVSCPECGKKIPSLGRSLETLVKIIIAIVVFFAVVGL
jgi:hypothetical protein